MQTRRTTGVISVKKMILSKQKLKKIINLMMRLETLETLMVNQQAKKSKKKREKKEMLLVILMNQHMLQ